MPKKACFKIPENGIIIGDALETLKKFPDNCIDSIVTDPPYGYAFMGKNWDKAVMGIKYWKECLRVLKNGAFAFVMSSPRQDVLSHMIINLSEAGFNTGFTSIYWAYASGFPKASNIGKMADKRLGNKRKTIGQGKRHDSKSFGEDIYGKYKGGVPPETKGASPIEGSYGGFQPKPAVEIILVCMKPLSEKTYVDQALKNKKGITWLDDCRVPYESNKDKEGARFGTQMDIRGGNLKTPIGIKDKNVLSSSKGRFPANLLVSDDVLNDGKSHKTGKPQGGYGDMGIGIGKPAEHQPYKPRKRGNLNSTSKERKYGYKKCVPIGSEQGRFPANLLVSDDVLNDGRITKSGQNNVRRKHGKFVEHDLGGIGMRQVSHPDSGSYSRYFDLDKWAEKTFPFLIVPKASKREKNKGCGNLSGEYKSYTKNRRCKKCGHQQVSGSPCKCENPEWEIIERKTTTKNNHPTVKPVKLMTYLITLGSRPNDTVLDPFMGSGTTGIACKILNRRFVGIELNKEYFAIAKARIAAAQKNLL